MHYSPADGLQAHVGSLALNGGRPLFQFAASWLADWRPLAPLTMTPQTAVIEGPTNMPDRLHGLFADSLPDAWGRLLADRHLAKRRLRRDQVTVLDRLALVGTRGRGALTYHPADGNAHHAFVPDLDALTDEAGRVLEGSASSVLPKLIAAAGASGGARPKILVGLDDRDRMIADADGLPRGYVPYLVKLGSRHDPPEAAAAEFAYLEMARAAGLRVPEGRLLHTARASYFAIARFDRAAGDRRTHMVTASGLTDIPQDYFAVQYGELGSAIARVCESYTEAHEFARRMAFNVLARNRDDHLKNTALLMTSDGSWRLSPAYDLTFSPGPGGEHSMLIDGEGRLPTLAHLMRAAASMGVEQTPMREIVAEVTAAVTRWNDFADEGGLSAARRREIGSTLRKTRRAALHP